MSVQPPSRPEADTWNDTIRNSGEVSSACPPQRDSGETGPIIPIAEYRRLLKDDTSTDEQILNRLEYLESFCRNIIRNEIKTYVSKKPEEKI